MRTVRGLAGPGADGRVTSGMLNSGGPRGATEKAVDGSSAPMRPISGFNDCAARSRMRDAFAPLLVASPGSGPPGSPNLSSRFSAAPLERDVPVLARRSLDRLAQAELQPADQLTPRLARFDDIVDVPTFRRDVGVGEFRGVLRDQLLAPGRRIFRAGQVALVDDVHRGFRAHDRDLGGR